MRRTTVLPKGINELLATILIIAIGVIVAGIMLGWYTGLTQQETRRLSNQSSDIVACPVVRIEEVYLDFSANKSRAFVKSSDSDIILSAKLLAKSGEEAGNITFLPLNMSRGEIKVIEFNLTGKISNCGNFSEVLVSNRCVTDSFKQLPSNCG